MGNWNSQNTDVENHFFLAMYLLNRKFNTPWDLIKYWSIAGPCMENYPEIEKYPDNNARP